MKKTVMTFLCMMLILTGCGKKAESFDSSNPDFNYDLYEKVKAVELYGSGEDGTTKVSDSDIVYQVIKILAELKYDKSEEIENDTYGFQEVTILTEEEEIVVGLTSYTITIGGKCYALERDNADKVITEIYEIFSK